MQISLLEYSQEIPSELTNSDKLARAEMQVRRVKLRQMIETEEGRLKVKLLADFAWQESVSLATAYRYYDVLFQSDRICEEETEFGVCVYTREAMAEIKEQQRRDELQLKLDRELAPIRDGLEALNK